MKGIVSNRNAFDDVTLNFEAPLGLPVITSMPDRHSFIPLNIPDLCHHLLGARACLRMIRFATHRFLRFQVVAFAHPHVRKRAMAGSPFGFHVRQTAHQTHRATPTTRLNKSHAPFIDMGWRRRAISSPTQVRRGSGSWVDIERLLQSLVTLSSTQYGCPV